MAEILSKVLTYAAFPAVAVLAGALISLVREPSSGFRSAVQHFAAGTVFSVLAVELLPDLMHRKMPWPTLIGFTLGVALMLTLKWFGDKESETQDTRNTRGLLLAVGTDVTLDGVLIGLSFAAGARQGLLLTVGLVL
jgi:ZIP family zinc transporter